MKFNVLFFLLLFWLLSCASNSIINNALEKEEFTNLNISKKEKKSIEIVEENPFIYQDIIYDSLIKTVLFHPSGDSLNEAIIPLNREKKLVLRFDDLSSQYRDFKYQIIYCNADWTKSKLFFNEYAEGFQENNFINYTPSINPLISYINYQVSLPNNDFQFKKSGNYALVAFIENLETPVFIKCFKIYENQVKINPDIHVATNVRLRNYYQEVDFEIDKKQFNISNPFNDIKVVINQNYRRDNQITDLIPQFVNGNIIKYDYNEGNLFPGNNEYRYINLKNINVLNGAINSNKFSEKHGWQVRNRLDEPRSFRRYSRVGDIDGGFIIKNDFSVSSDHISSDYLNVEFFLKTGGRRVGGIYLFGKLSDYMIKKKFKLKYDLSRNLYTAKILLKQGLYNYNYAYSVDAFRADFIELEGIHSETENIYTITIYYRPIGLDYDRIIGYVKIKNRQF